MSFSPVGGPGELPVSFSPKESDLSVLSNTTATYKPSLRNMSSFGKIGMKIAHYFAPANQAQHPFAKASFGFALALSSPFIGLTAVSSDVIQFFSEGIHNASKFETFLRVLTFPIILPASVLLVIGTIGSLPAALIHSSQNSDIEYHKGIGLDLANLSRQLQTGRLLVEKFSPDDLYTLLEPTKETAQFINQQIDLYGETLISQLDRPLLQKELKETKDDTRRNILEKTLRELDEMPQLFPLSNSVEEYLHGMTKILDLIKQQKIKHQAFYDDPTKEEIHTEPSEKLNGLIKNKLKENLLIVLESQIDLLVLKSIDKMNKSLETEIDKYNQENPNVTFPPKALRKSLTNLRTLQNKNNLLEVINNNLAKMGKTLQTQGIRDDAIRLVKIALLKNKDLLIENKNLETKIDPYEWTF